MSKKFFISDTHWGHANVIRFDNRPFDDVEEMDDALIRNWNSKVRENDDVYHLGDFAFMEEGRLINVLKRLNGNIHLIWGNHDQLIMKSKKLQSYFMWCRHYHEVKENGETYCLFHYPIGEWNKAHRGAFHLHGHTHGSYKYPRDGRIMDVGANCIGYTPIELSEVYNKLKNKPLLEHH